MRAELLERPALSLAWQALITEEGEPFAAFVRGHVNPFTLAGDAEDYIVKAFGDLSPALASDAREIIDEAGGAVISQFWLRPEDNEDGAEFYIVATAGQRRAFPVTGARFQVMAEIEHQGTVAMGKPEPISRELLGKIVDEVFDGAIEDASVIEEIYAAIKKHETPSPQDRSRGPADQIIAQIEALFPNWQSYRDLVDCIECTLHRLKAEGGR